jgi:ATP-binding cassette subfamily B protein
VPQSVFLADASIARNVAFGMPESQVDMERVIESCRIAQLQEFIGTLPDGYQTMVGERGIRLSGGQRQRLAIARAVYKNAALLVLDEATNALDDATEHAVMTALDLLRRDGRTIILIGHRQSAIATADMIVRLDRGSMVPACSSAAPSLLAAAQ